MLLTYTGTDVANLVRSVWVNDPNGRIYTDARLLPIIIAVFEELVDDLVEIDAPVTYLTKTGVTVNIGTTEILNSDIDANLRIVEPFKMWERPFGSVVPTDYVLMTRWDFLPTRAQTDFLTDWSWQRDRVALVGSTSKKDVMLEYSTYPVAPTAIGNTISLANSKQYVALKVAAIAAFTIGQSESVSTSLYTLAEKEKEKFFNTITKAGQWKPLRRPAYRRPLRRIGMGGARS